MKLRFLIILFATLSAFAQPKTRNILFLGNSLTYTNNLPEILEYIAKDFDQPLVATSLCFPNYALEDHWNDGLFQKLMVNKKFDDVIVQQGPSSQPPGKEMLITYGSKIKTFCTKKGVDLGFYMVWPSKQYYFTFDGVIANYTYAAEIHDANLFPVGSVWKDYQTITTLENLYSADNFHPSSAGSFLAALTIFKGLYPDKNLADLKHKKYRKWVRDQESFNTMIQLISSIYR